MGAAVPSAGVADRRGTRTGLRHRRRTEAALLDRRAGMLINPRLFRAFAGPAQRGGELKLLLASPVLLPHPGSEGARRRCSAAGRAVLAEQG